MTGLVGTVPAWAEWTPAGGKPAWSVGLEEAVMLRDVDVSTGSCQRQVHDSMRELARREPTSLCTSTSPCPTPRTPSAR